MNPLSINRRQALITAGAGLLPGAMTFAQSSTSIDTAKIQLGVPPGGLGDRLARSIAERLRGVYANNVVVENKPGAGGQIAVVAARDGAVDGSNLLLSISSAFSVYPYTYPKLPYKPEELAPLTLACYANHGLAVGPLVPDSVKNLREFLAWAKANPDKATFGSPAAGSIAHLVMAHVEHTTKSGLRHVPYRGSGPGVTDLLGGQIAAMSSPAGVFLPHAAAGKCRMLAISGAQRSSYFKDVPTYREQGINITAREWYGFFLPGKASAEVIARASQAFQKVLSSPELIVSFSQLGLDVAFSSPQELQQILRSDDLEWRDAVRQIGFTADS
jgi:tripartite-type tricarboxylate transporter receptor subunit TctC